MLEQALSSEEIIESLNKVLPGGVNSPIRSFPNISKQPMIASHAKDDKIYDVDGNAFIDYCMSWGALILGHAHPKIIEAVKCQIEKGTSYGVSTEIEGKIGNKICSLIPCIDKVRFVSSGTEATMSAIRVARGVTKRNKIIKFVGNYHGHADAFMVSAGSYLNLLENEPSTLGIPKETVMHTIALPFNDTQALSTFFSEFESLDDIAAIILEPVAGNIGVVPSSHEFLQLLRQKATEIGALLIFDEVITGFRVGLQGASLLYQIEPDMICFGKIIGGGFPAAAFGGKKEIMDQLAPIGPIFQAGTLSGNPVAMQAGYATLCEIEKPRFYEQLTSKKERLLAPIITHIKENNLNMCVHKVGSMFSFFFGTKDVHTSHDLANLDQDLFNEFFCFLYERGIYFSPAAFESNFLSAAHSLTSIDYTREVILEFLKENHTKLTQ